MVRHPKCEVSVVMLAVDRPQYIDAAIASVRSQSFQNWELVVLHDGSDDRIRQAVAPWVQVDPRIRYLHRPVLGNIANALNFAIEQTESDLVAILDDDDWWIEPLKLQRQVAMLTAHAEVVCVGGGAVVADGTGREMMRYLKPCDPEECRRRGLLANPLIHSTALYRRAAARAIGGYDEGLAAYADWDFCLRLMTQGRLLNLPEYYVTYRVWEGGSSSRYGMSIAWSAFRIVNRHRRNYRYFAAALGITLGHLGFALLPGFVRRRAYQFLTRLKKRIFSPNPRATG